MPTTPQAQNYGEPWCNNLTGDSSIHTAKGGHIAYVVGPDDGILASRIIETVNACATITDPQQAIAAAREAISNLLLLVRLKYGNLDPDANVIMRQASDTLHLLQPND